MKFCLIATLLFLLILGLTNGTLLRFRSIKDGNYLDLASSVNEGTRVTANSRNDNSDNQKWEVNLDKAINNIHTDFFTYAQNDIRIKVMDEDITSATVATWGDIGASNQRWTLKSNGIGYQIINWQSKKCLSNQGGGQQIKTFDCNGNDSSQIWTYENFDTSPPISWQENWWEHVQNLRRVYVDSDVAVYYDNDLPSNVTWIHKFVSDSWHYIKRLYGNFGPDGVLYAIFHRKKYGGGHPGYFFSSSHSFRNTVDQGSEASDAFENDAGWYIDVILHEISHVVETCYRGFQGTPARAIWEDSQFAPIFMIDVYYNIGRTKDGDDALNTYGNSPDGKGIYWTRDWFYPIYRDYGRGEVLNRFFKLLVQHYPRNGRVYSKNMNWGEFVHFWSGAAGRNLRTLATTAFKWNAQMDAELEEAKKAFPGIVYN